MLFFRKPGAGPKKKDAKQQCHRVDVSGVEVVCGLYNPAIGKRKVRLDTVVWERCWTGISCQHWEWQEDGVKHA